MDNTVIGGLIGHTRSLWSPTRVVKVVERETANFWFCTDGAKVSKRTGRLAGYEPGTTQYTFVTAGRLSEIQEEEQLFLKAREAIEKVQTASNNARVSVDSAQVWIDVCEMLKSHGLVK